MATDVLHGAEATHKPAHAGTPGKAALASWIGSALEYYDFFVYAIAAALVLGKLFFPGTNPATGILLALASHGVGYVARPVGALLLGPIGDRLGRKVVLVFTLVLMGASTFLVGCLPTYDQVGIAAPILLVVLRLAQGLSASGEQAGANSMTLEHSPPDQRAYFTSFTLSGTQAGLILANAVFLPITFLLSEEQLLSWGWRVPFWLSAVVVAIGFWIRRTLEETPVFLEEKEHQEVPKTPLATLFKDYGTDVARVICSALVSTVSTIFGVYALSYATNVVKIDRTTILWLTIVTNLVALVAIPLWAKLADRVGRRPVYITGALIPGLLMFPYLWSISQANVPLMFLFGVMMSGVFYSASNGVWPAFFGEMFDTRVRLSGMAIGTQIGFAIAGFMPAVGAAIQGEGPNGWVPVAVLTLIACIIASVAVWTARETYNVPMHDLGRK
jgi:MFS family permease